MNIENNHCISFECSDLILIFSYMHRKGYILDYDVDMSKDDKFTLSFSLNESFHSKIMEMIKIISKYTGYKITIKRTFFKTECMYVTLTKEEKLIELKNIMNKLDILFLSSNGQYVETDEFTYLRKGLGL